MSSLVRHTLALSILILFFSSTRSHSQTTFKSIASDFAKADTVEKKRDICIKAIDAGLIVLEIKLDTLKSMFLEDFTITSTNNDGSGSGLILFSRHYKVPPRGDVQAAPPTWRLVFDYDAKREITFYYLTNTGHSPSKSMRGPLDRPPSAILQQPMPPPDFIRRK